MSGTRLVYALFTLSVVFSCARAQEKTFTCENFSFKYPSSFSVNDREQSDGGRNASFILKDDDCPSDYIEFSLSAFPPSFLNDMAPGQLILEMKMEVDELVDRLQDVKHFIITDKGPLCVQDSGFPKEVYVSLAGTVDQEERYAQVSYIVMQGMSIESISWASSKEKFDTYFSIFDSFTLKQ